LYDGCVRRLLRASILLLASVGCVAQTFDLRPYGFLPTRNEDYKPREYTGIVQYLADGSLVVSFHLQGVLVASPRGPERNLEPVEIVRLDSRTGRLLARTRAMASIGIPYLWPKGDGLLLVAGPWLLELGPDLKKRTEMRIGPNVDTISLVPALQALAIYPKSTEAITTVELMDWNTRQPISLWEMPFGVHAAFFRDGYVAVAHDKEGQRYLRVVHGNDQFQAKVPELPCRTKLLELKSDAALALTCEQFEVVNEEGRIVMEGSLGQGDEAPVVFTASAAPRFGIATIEGFPSFARDEQRIHGKQFRIAVYDLEKRAKIFSYKVDPLPKLGGAFALSPDGRRMALLEDGQVRQIDLP
jgi:hypothetical protein